MQESRGQSFHECFPMLAKVHIAGWGLLGGAFGQSLLFANLFSTAPFFRLIFFTLLIPWAVVYTISFCRSAPFGPRGFRKCLIFAMGFYAAATLIADTLPRLLKPSQHGAVPDNVARVLMYAGALSFLAFIPVCRQLRTLELPQSAKISGVEPIL